MSEHKISMKLHYHINEISIWKWFFSTKKVIEWTQKNIAHLQHLICTILRIDIIKLSFDLARVVYKIQFG